MATIKAVDTIVSANGIVTGFILEEVETGKRMQVPSNSIIEAVKNGKIVISNLTITTDNRLVMTDLGNVTPGEVSTKQMAEVIKATAELPVKLSPHANDISDKVKELIDSTLNDEQSKINRIHELVDKLNEARKVYEQGTDEIMSNFEYDKLYDELLALEEETGTVLSNSPTQNVGYEVVSALSKETHNTPMLSLAKTKDREELVGWLNGKEGVLSWKLDGLTVVLTYDNGTLTKAVTRGNGEIGEVVTANAKTFANVPASISYKGHLVLRGEATISYDNFEKINAKIADTEEKYKNPRNLASGSVRQLDSSITAKRHVEWTVFEVVEADEELPNELNEQFKWASSLGFKVVQHMVVTPENVVRGIEKFEEVLKTGKMNTPSDGLVLALNDRKYGFSLGKTSKFYRHSIAFKWGDEEVISKMQYVEWSPSRTGLINPVAVFDPVDIEGSTVSRASVHNVSIFLDLQLGVGDRVKVYKANMIIPQISENLDRTGTIEIPGTCPCCGCETEVHEDPNSGVYTLWCPNPDCDAKGNRLFEHFVSRNAMNIDGISGATIETLKEAGVLTDLPSIFHIAEHRSDIVNLEGFGETSFANMVYAVDNARNVKVANLIYALGIPNIGLSTAKLICKNFGNDIAEIVDASYEQLINIDGIGDVIAESFVGYFEDEDNLDQFVRLVKELHIVHEEVSTDTSMQGVVICVTGAVNIFPNRDAVKQIVESKGGKLTGSVSKSTSYLVTNDTTSGSRKNKAAQEYGIPILTEQEFIDKFNIQL